MKTAMTLLLVLFVSGCAGYTTKEDGSKEPAAVGVMREASIALKNCPKPEKYTPVDIAIKSCEPGDDACHNALALNSVTNAFVRMEHDEEIAQNADKSCPAQVAKQVMAYFDSQGIKYKAISTSIGTGIRWAGGYFIIDSVTGNLIPQQGDTNVETVNVNNETGAGGGGGEGAGGASGNATQNVNIGPGSSKQFKDTGDVLSGEKATKGDGNTDDDSPNTSIF